MSDNYIKISPIKEIENEADKAQLVIKWMQNNQFIEQELSGSGLGSGDLAYRPGSKHVDIIGYDENITRLGACGVEFTVGRQVFNSLAFSPMTKMNCKFCGSNRFKEFTPQQFYSDLTPPKLLELYNVMFEIFEKWEQDLPAPLTCPECLKESNLDEYEIEGSICLTNLGITFWNWPDLKPAFIEELEKLFQTPLKRINGHL